MKAPATYGFKQSLVKVGTIQRLTPSPCHPKKVLAFLTKQLALLPPPSHSTARPLEMSFTGCSRVSIKGKNTFNHVEGNQINGTVHGNVIFNAGQEVVRRTKYDQFHEVILGDVILEKELHSSDFDWKLKHWKVLARHKTQRTIYTVEIVDRTTKFTAMTYEGEDAKRVWEEDFERFSCTKNLGSFQLFGINQSSIPMLIFHNELIPLQHFYKSSFWSSVYLTCLVENNGWSHTSVWMDMRGSLCGGAEGPYAYWIPSDADGSLIVPTKADMLKDNICFQFFCKIRSRVDDSILWCAHYSRGSIFLDDLLLGTADDPRSKNPDDPVWNSTTYSYLCDLQQDPFYHLLMNIISELQFDTVYSPSMEAVARWPQGAGSLWELDQSEQRGLVDETVLDGGLTHFMLDLTHWQNVHLEASYNNWKLQSAWLSQSSWVFGALNVTEGEEHFFLIDLPSLTIESTLHEYDGLTAFFNLCDGKPPIKETPPAPSPIYLFLHPFPKSLSELITWRCQPYFWSFDKTGQSGMSEEECEKWGLPVLTSRIIGHFWVPQWPTYTYTALQDWQEACDFDPATSDWARSRRYPEFEVVSQRCFEEVVDIQEKETSSSWWEAIVGSGISAFGF
ncbi:hypothetical protein Moror_14611 [Moniliophthora roreri MCA 2997]|uniref:Uncharacterized protein n=1 Tax=Moniliophthora roreri (strain MCA 2997) TaxID=1381753 RepID=V2XK66_MONRO|nr:hypothetical protein Moror_14611 [Moniliophthora roreri MCA 2997]